MEEKVGGENTTLGHGRGRGEGQRGALPNFRPGRRPKPSGKKFRGVNFIFISFNKLFTHIIYDMNGIDFYFLDNKDQTPIGQETRASLESGS